MVKSISKRVVALLGLTGLAFGAPATAKTAPAHPALWEVSDKDTTIYLFGTIHLLPAGYHWRTPAFDRALDGTQQLFVETIVDDKNPGKLMAAMSSIGFDDKLPPLAQRIPAAKRPALQKAIAATPLPPAAFNRMKTWMAAFLLLGNQFQKIGLKGPQGVEAILRNQFIAQGKPVGELESNVEQLGFFNALPESAQLALLEGALEDPKAGMDKQFGAMLKAWGNGDVASVAKTFDQDMKASPELKQILIERRNANWSRWIENRMAQPGEIIVAVGAGHLAGRQSVLEMLKRDGYRVKRLQ
jgi:uncharacterized protein YbaP (TraB family)